MSIAPAEKEESVLEVRPISKITHVIRTSNNRVATVSGRTILKELICKDEEEAEEVMEKEFERVKNESTLTETDIEIICGFINTVMYDKMEE